jgi:hypothetical protein
MGSGDLSGSDVPANRATTADLCTLRSLITASYSDNSESTNQARRLHLDPCFGTCGGGDDDRIFERKIEDVPRNQARLAGLSVFSLNSKNSGDLAQTGFQFPNFFFLARRLQAGSVFSLFPIPKRWDARHFDLAFVIYPTRGDKNPLLGSHGKCGKTQQKQDRGAPPHGRGFPFENQTF